MPEEWCSVSDFQYFVEFVIKSKTLTDKTPMQLQINKAKNTITFKIKIFQFKMVEIMKLRKMKKKLQLKIKVMKLLHITVYQPINSQLWNCDHWLSKKIQMYTFVANQYVPY